MSEEDDDDAGSTGGHGMNDDEESDDPFEAHSGFLSTYSNIKQLHLHNARLNHLLSYGPGALSSHHDELRKHVLGIFRYVHETERLLREDYFARSGLGEDEFTGLCNFAEHGANYSYETWISVEGFAQAPTDSEARESPEPSGPHDQPPSETSALNARVLYQSSRKAPSESTREQSDESDSEVGESPEASGPHDQRLARILYQKAPSESTREQSDESFMEKNHWREEWGEARKELVQVFEQRFEQERTRLISENKQERAKSERDKLEMKQQYEQAIAKLVEQNERNRLATRAEISALKSTVELLSESRALAESDGTSSQAAGSGSEATNSELTGGTQSNDGGAQSVDDEKEGSEAAGATTVDREAVRDSEELGRGSLQPAFESADVSRTRIRDDFLASERQLVREATTATTVDREAVGNGEDLGQALLVPGSGSADASRAQRRNELLTSERLVLREITARLGFQDVVVMEVRVVEVTIAQLVDLYDLRNPRLLCIDSILQGFVTIVYNISRHKKMWIANKQIKGKKDTLIDLDVSGSIGAMAAQIDQNTVEAQSLMLPEEIRSSLEQLKAALKVHHAGGPYTVNIDWSKELKLESEDKKRMKQLFVFDQVIANLLMHCFHTKIYVGAADLLLLGYLKLRGEDREMVISLLEEVLPGSTFEDVEKMSLLDFIQKIILPSLLVDELRERAIALICSVTRELTDTRPVSENSDDGRKGSDDERKKHISDAFRAAQAQKLWTRNADDDVAVDYCAGDGDTQQSRKKRIVTLNLNMCLCDEIPKLLPSCMFPNGFAQTLLTHAPSKVQKQCIFQTQDARYKNFFGGVHDSESEWAKRLRTLEQRKVGAKAIIVDSSVVGPLTQLLED